MTYRQALRLAVKTMHAQRRRLAFDANLCERFGASNPAAVRAARERRRLGEAIKFLESEGNKKDGPKAVTRPADTGQ